MGFDSYSAWTHCKSFQKEYKIVTQFQVTLEIFTFSPIVQVSNLLSLRK